VGKRKVQAHIGYQMKIAHLSNASDGFLRGICVAPSLFRYEPRSSHRLRLKCQRCRRPHAQARAHGTSTRGYEHWHRSGFRQKRASSESRASSPHTRKIARGHKRSRVSRDRMICYISVTMVVSELAPTEKSRC
jgi:hypothetical protein